LDDYKEGVSQENVDIVMRVFAAFGRRDNAAVFDMYDPDIEWNMDGYENWPDARSYRGIEGVKAFFRDWLRDFDEYETAALDPLDLGDRVRITVYDKALGRGSGVEIERYHAHVWTFRGNRVARIEVFDSREAALAACEASAKSAEA
jgi:ketosteroid isomerase-like protein